MVFYSNPIISLNPSCISLAKAFAKMSTTINCVGQCSNSTILFSIFYLIKWCCTSICFDLFWLVGFLDNVIEPWLLHMMVVASSCTQPSSSINCPSQIPSLVQQFMAMYSASIVDCATICFYKTVSCPTNNTYPNVDLRFSTSPAQSASENPWTLIWLHLVRNFISKVPFK